MTGEFVAYGTSHLVVLGLSVVGAVLVIRWGREVRRVRGSGAIGPGSPGAVAEERARRAFAVAIVVVALPMQLLQFLPGDWDFATSLPLQLCDLAIMVSVYALWTRAPWAAALAYYWGVTLTTQAMLTPALTQSFPHPRFVGFWALHALVVWAALFLTVGLGIRPDWRLYRLTVIVTAAWAVVMMTFNAATGTNYGYLNSKPRTASALDLLGPWPGYVLAEVAIVAVAWALLTLPWVLGSSRRAGLVRRQPTAGGR